MLQITYFSKGEQNFKINSIVFKLFYYRQKYKYSGRTKTRLKISFEIMGTIKRIVNWNLLRHFY